MASKAAKEVLVTDTLFINKDQEAEFERAGYKVFRIPKPDASEEELIKAIKGKSAYIIGGIELVTPKVIAAADKLEVIDFTGVSWKEFIPGWQEATKKGIAIANAPGCNATAVGEYTVALILLMLRQVLSLGRTGTKKFGTTPSLPDVTVGIIGMGNIGTKVSRYLTALGVKQILYFSRTRKPALEKELGIKFATMDEVLRSSDVITLHVPKDAGDNLIGAKQLKMMKDGAILINADFEHAVDFNALKKEIKAGRLRAAFDFTPTEDFGDIPADQFFCSGMTAWNTKESGITTSELVTKSVLNILKSGDDKHLVNPEYRNYRKR